jgi:pyruvate kinase
MLSAETTPAPGCGRGDGPIALRAGSRSSNSRDFSAIVRSRTRGSFGRRRPVDARAILCFTETGKTALLLSKFVRGRPIFAIARRAEACRQATLYPGVLGLTMTMPPNTDRMIDRGKARLARLGHLRRADRVVVVSGSARVRGATNLMKVDTV